MNCKQCDSEFDESDHRPKLLPKCGDSICARCLETLRQSGKEFHCPADGIVYSSTTEIFDNAYILNFIVPSKGDLTHCPKHGKELELYCGDCEIEICPSCVLFGEHKHHKYEQLGDFKARFAAILAEFQQRVEAMDRGLSQKFADASLVVQKSRSEKLQLIDTKFDELIALATKVRNSAKDQLNAAHDSVLSNADLLRSRMKSLSERIAECARGKNRLKQDYLLREIRDLEASYEKSEILKGKEAIAARTELAFSRQVLDGLWRFATVGRTANHSTPKSFAKSSIDIMDEDNLLQESFKELLKGSIDSPLEDSEPPEQRTPPLHPSNKRKSFAPISTYSSGTSPRSLNVRKEEKGLIPLNQTLAEPRKLSLSPTNISVLGQSQVIRSGVVISPFKSSVLKSTILDKENQELPTNLKVFDRKNSVMDRINYQFDSVSQGRSSILDLSSAGIDDKGLESVSKRWSDLKSCKTIKLNNNMITDQGLKFLLKSIKDMGVEYLFLNNNGLKETALDYVISFRKYNSTMKCVYLGNNSISKTSSKTRMKLRLLEEGSISVVL